MRFLITCVLLIATTIRTENITRLGEKLAKEQARELVRNDLPVQRNLLNGTEFIGDLYPSNATCRAKYSPLKRLYYLLNKQCPVYYNIIEDDRSLYDPDGIIRYRCHNFRPIEFRENKVYTLTSSQLLTVLNSPPKDPYKRNWCMITFFYSPKCVFSEELAPTINAMPLNYPQIVTVAVDATSFSRYGIAGTPTVLLWVNGVPISRMDDKHLNSTGLNEFFDDWTDARSLNLSRGEEHPIYIKHAPLQEQWETPAAILTLILAAIYYWRSWVLRQAAVCSTLRRFGTTPEAVGAFLNGM